MTTHSYLDLSYEEGSDHMCVGAAPVWLPQMRLQIMSLLIRRGSMGCSQDDLIDHVYQCRNYDEPPTEKSMTASICYLRRFLEPYGLTIHSRHRGIRMQRYRIVEVCHETA